jgi:hypothetical protein
MTMKEHFTLFVIDITSGFILYGCAVSADRTGEVIQTGGLTFEVA